MDAHDQFLREVQILSNEGVELTLPDLFGSDRLERQLAAQDTEPAAEVVAANVTLRGDASPQAMALAAEVFDLKQRRNATRVAGSLAARVADPRRTGTARAVARSWILGTAW